MSRYFSIESLDYDASYNRSFDYSRPSFYYYPHLSYSVEHVGLPLDIQGEFAELLETAFVKDADSEVTLTEEEIEHLYLAKCEDQGLVATYIRASRFANLINNTCGGLLFSLKEHGLAVNGARALCEILADNKKYSILELCGNRLRDDGTVYLAKLFEYNDTIVRLDLRSNDIGGRGAEAMFNSLFKNCTLTSIDLSGLSGINRNHISVRGASALSRLLYFNTTISHLNLGSNGLGTEGIRILCQGLKNNGIIIELDLSSNSMGPKGAQYVAEAIDSMPQLRKLLLERNNIGDKGCSELSAALRNGEGYKITYLDISENKITFVGLKDLCDTLKRSGCQLTTLKLDRNGFGDHGAEELGNMLETNESLKTLSINKNDIQYRGTIALAKALEDRNSTLLKLDLGNNYIDEENLESMTEEYKLELRTKKTTRKNESLGTKALAAAIAKNKTLYFFDLSNNGIRNEGGYALAKSIQSNSSLLSLIIKQNDMRDADEDLVGLVINEQRKNLKGAQQSAGSAQTSNAAAGAGTAANAQTSGSGSKNALPSAVGAGKPGQAYQATGALDYNTEEHAADRCGDKLAAALKKNTTLLELDFSYNAFSYKSYSAISEYLKRNIKLWKQEHKIRLQSYIDNLEPNVYRLIDVNANIEREMKAEQDLYQDLEQKKQDLEKNKVTYEQQIVDMEAEHQRLEQERRGKESEYQQATDELERTQNEVGSKTKKLEARMTGERQKLEYTTKAVKKTRREIEEARRNLVDSNKTLYDQLDRETKECERLKVGDYAEAAALIKELQMKIEGMEALLAEEQALKSARSNSGKGTKPTGTQPSSARSTAKPGTNRSSK